MPVFKVVVHGRGLWISIDDEVQRMGFYVTRFVDAADADQAARKALALVREDARSRPEPGHLEPALAVGEIVPTSAIPSLQPGFAFFPDPE